MSAARACEWCGAPLTRRKQRRFCSRSCAKTHYHAEHPDAATRFGCTSWEKTGKRKFYTRLQRELAGCRSMVDAYLRGRHNGYALGRRHERRVYRKKLAA